MPLTRTTKPRLLVLALVLRVPLVRASDSDSASSYQDSAFSYAVHKVEPEETRLSVQSIASSEARGL